MRKFTLFVDNREVGLLDVALLEAQIQWIASLEQISAEAEGIWTLLSALDDACRAEMIDGQGDYAEDAEAEDHVNAPFSRWHDANHN